jgi:siroheme synthase (precorrin-2 oxidase/ferrochelatase)
VADRPADCDFHLPAVADLPPLRLAVTTGGASPALSAIIAAELRERYRGRGRLAALLARLRPEIMAAVPDPSRRRAILTELAGDPGLTAGLAEDRIEEARARLGELLAPLGVEAPDEL